MNTFDFHPHTVTPVVAAPSRPLPPAQERGCSFRARHRISPILGLGLLAFLLGEGPANADPLGLLPLGPSKPSQLITLLSTIPGSPACPTFQVHFDRVLESDGTTTPFAGVPAETVLVVTGFDWKVTGTQANQAITGEISVQTGAEATQLIEVTSTSDGTGRAGGQIHGHNIAVIQSGPSICFGVNSSISTEAARLYGYLTADE